jgi:DNA repair protein RecN (Recombination protein N)
LSELGRRLIDVHSQHQTLQLTEHDFQFKVLDALADNMSLLVSYRELRKKYQQAQKALDLLVETRQNALKEKDYNAFLLQELEAAPLKPGIQEELEEQQEQLNNVETIMEQLGSGFQLLNDEQLGIQSLLRELRLATAKLVRFGKQYSSLHDRVQSVLIETDDIAEEFASARDAVESDPARLEEVGNRLQLLYDLQKKHHAADVEELIRIKNELSVKVEDTQRLDTDIEEKKMELEGDRRAMEEQASGLSNRRQKVIPELKDQLEALLHSLGIPNAAFNLVLQPTTEYRANGKDTLLFLFSANKGGAFGELKKVASGGELSRIMLAIKSVLARYEPLPTMMFDEIDTGVSGEISNRMAEIMLQMSKSMQVFSITHLPQVASKGDQHFKVFKEDDGAVTRTRIRELGPDERIVELAEMLGGKSLSDSALAHARQLLN